MNVFPASWPRTAQALIYKAPRRAVIEGVGLLAANGGDPKAYALVRTKWSAVSRGTERLVFEGRVPASEYARMRGPHQEGDFPFPVKYGYAAAGIVEDGPPDLIGKDVFALYPHQDRFVIEAEALVPVPEAVPLRRAALAANMETALNALWDSEAGPCCRILIIGGGVVGLLVAALAARLPGASVCVADIDEGKRPITEKLGARFARPEETPGEADIVFHTSGASAGLELALQCAGFEARIVEMSWYGDASINVPLGGSFHSKRLTLQSSQVGHVAPRQRPRWPHARRLAAALSLLADPVFDALITEEVAFAALPEKLPHILSPHAPGLAPVVRYD